MPVSNASDSESLAQSGDAPTPAVRFAVCLDSPFADGYDIAAERRALADLVTAENADAGDPRWARLIELREREGELLKLSHVGLADSGASASARTKRSKLTNTEELIDGEPDTMTLHTKDAFALFTGRRADAEGRVASIAGGRRFAAATKSIWHLSARDNPYADWILIRVYDDLGALRRHLNCSSGSARTRWST